MNRRFFMRSGGIALASFGLITPRHHFCNVRCWRRLESLYGWSRKTLIAIFQRGAVDGLNMVVPYGERAYYDLRPGIAIGKPETGERRCGG